MAKKSSDKSVTRIKASDTKPVKKQTSASSTKANKVSKVPKALKVPKFPRFKKASKAPKVAKESRGIIGYFKGAWFELRQVHWPTRQATWGLTLAVIAFSGFFVVFILLIDALFKFMFETILK